ncbi:MAG: IS21-like element helper ATPase IstB [Candidatus Sericytochromatia bacterium]|nr:IS21-like element helper ATPase IstB [Candidatus Tanganyikabacteria bacterium]
MPSSTKSPPSPALAERFAELASQFRLPTVAAEAFTRFTAAGQADALDTLVEVFEMEAQDRKDRRIERLRRASKLPVAKTFETLDLNRLPRKLVAKIRELARGHFLDRADNILAFGLPGVGKSHAACAIGHDLVAAGRSVLFAPTYDIVQHLLAAKRDLELPRALAKLDAFEVVILDDIGYVKQDRDEMEVLFTLMAERYERRSMIITSNLLFSEWDQIFKNPMTTAAAIDRVVHHSTILEFNVPSYRADTAKTRSQADRDQDE